MDYTQYSSLYHTFIAAMLQTDLFSFLARTVFADYPHRLPPFLQERYNEDIEHIRQNAHLLEGTGRVTLQFADESVTLLTLGTLAAQQKAGRSDSAIEFEQIASSQQVVLTVARLEAFLADTVEVIATRQPAVMTSKDRVLSWDDIIASGGRDELFARMADDFAHSLLFGKPIEEVIGMLRRRFGLTLSFPDSAVRVLDDARQLRHIIVHNGGRADQKYLKETRRTDVSAGEVVSIPTGWVRSASGYAQRLAGEVFIQTSQKYFGIVPSDDPFIITAASLPT